MFWRAPPHTGVPFFYNSWVDKCQGNTYPCTIHAITSALCKMGRIETVARLYRGVSGMALPGKFASDDVFAVRGGVEWGSTCKWRLPSCRGAPPELPRRPFRTRAAPLTLSPL